MVENHAAPPVVTITHRSPVGSLATMRFAGAAREGHSRRRGSRRRPGRRWQLAAVGALAAVCALVAGCTTPLAGRGVVVTPTSATPTATTPPQIALTDCSKQFDLGAAGIPAALLRHLTFKCGKVPVPLNYDNPTGPKIEIEVLRMHDDQAPAKVATLLMNPGGPGASGLALADRAGRRDLRGGADALRPGRLRSARHRPVELALTACPTTEQDKINSLDPNVLTPSGFAIAKAGGGRGRQRLHHEVRTGAGRLQHDVHRHGHGPASARRWATPS